MKIIVCGGKTGQLRQELERTSPKRYEVLFIARDEMDVTDESAVASACHKYQPDWIINASAYTAVDKAESEKAAAFAINETGVANLAQAAKQVGARMVHVSTDFVFNGQNSIPYPVDFPAAPIGVYGESKLAGENKVKEILANQALIIRTSWVYSAYGDNFVKTMLRLMREREELGVIADQAGTPTWARGLAETIWQAIEKQLFGIYHWTDAGITSWYDFAQAIYEEGKSLNLLSNEVTVVPITTEQYPTPARRPAYSVLDKTETWNALGTTSEHWRVSLRKMMQEL